MADETRAIEPTITAEEWKEFDTPAKARAGLIVASLAATTSDLRVFSFVMALANAALPDDDPRKITRENVDALAHLLDSHVPAESGPARLADQLIDALRALLPPEP